MSVLKDSSVVEDDIEFTEEQHDIWRSLYSRQFPKIEKYICKEYQEGFKNLQLPADHIPSVNELNEKITPRTGWKTVRTRVRYSDAVQWYRHFAAKEFLITDYVRTRDEMEFTPEPDMFHDVFGHLPFFTLPHYAEIQEMFAPAFHKATTDEQRENLKRLAWFSTEFGLIREKGELKIFGTGLISSSGEMEHVLAGNTPVEPFKVETIANFDKAIWSFNKTLFEFDSLSALKAELARYFDTF